MVKGKQCKWYEWLSMLVKGIKKKMCVTIKKKKEKKKDSVTF